MRIARKAIMLFGYTLLWLTILITAKSCKSGNNHSEQESVSMETLIGAWSLDNYFLGDSNLNSSQYPHLLYNKYLTGTHFVWACYDSAKDQVLGMAGGTYNTDHGNYTETYEFYLPLGSKKIGQTQVYAIHVVDDRWTQEGFEMNYNFDPDFGAVIASDSILSQQVWTRLNKHEDNDDQLIGTWVLEKYRTEEDSSWQYYPSFVRYIKLITPSHFFWIKYNGEDDEVMAGGGGPYAFKKDNFNLYQERIEQFYPHDSKQVGTEINFQLLLEDNKWYHLGYVTRVERGPNGKINILDSTKVDEVWVPYAIK